MKKRKKRQSHERAPAAPPAPAQADSAGESKVPSPETAVVALGASAGGLEALQAFFDHMPADSGLTFVVVTHQSPGRTSMLAELLGRHTTMAVCEATEGAAVQPDCVYVAPPGPDLAIAKGVLTLLERAEHGLHLPIDAFFRSLAQDQKQHAIGVLLSGTGSDGTLGIKEIKGAGGMVMAQDEQSARYPGMPQSAIATGLVDYVASAERLPELLSSYVRGSRRLDTTVEQPPEEVPRRVFALLRNRTGHDFSSYKPTTILRRLQRRMSVHQVDSLDRYARYLQTNPEEIDILFKELLIGVTSFFRDPDAFDVLATRVLPELLDDKPDDYDIRVWVPGCSTGEEAYSLAILLREYMDRSPKRLSAQIFASDLDASAIDSARAGVYPAGIAADVTKRRLDHFFFPCKDSHYQVNKDIRSMVVFAVQNLLADPPFSKLDLISCRNVLIYVDTALQNRLLPMFHYALNPGGVLFLGSAESVGESSQLFSSVDAKWKIFRKTDAAAGRYVAKLPVTASLAPRVSGLDATKPDRAGGKPSPSLAQMADEGLLAQLAPTRLVVREDGTIVHIHGRTGLYLELAPGRQDAVNLFRVAREGLSLAVSTAMRHAAKSETDALQRSVRIQTNGDSILVDVRAVRLLAPEAVRGLFVVSLQNPRPISAEESDAGEVKRQVEESATNLEQELQATVSRYQDVVEELETANEELRSTNEELQSTNEELQSSNEELETSKEEMQSLNEELHSVNAELQDKVLELAKVRDDLKNLLESTSVGTVFLDTKLTIQRFTEQAKCVIPLRLSDIGRPIEELVTHLHYDRLVDDAKEVLRTLKAKEVEVRAGRDAWYLVRVCVYRTTDNVIAGVVLVFLDITATKRAQAVQLTADMAQTVRIPLLVLDDDLRVVVANAAFCTTFGLRESDVTGQRIYEVDRGAWNIPDLRLLLEDVLGKSTTIEGFPVSLPMHHLARPMVLDARLLISAAGTPAHLLLAFREPGMDGAEPSVPDSASPQGADAGE